MDHRYPILLDLSRQTIVIVGGGKVAARKAAGLVDAGAKSITVVSIEFTDEFSPAVNCIERAYASDVLDGATLVFAATDQDAVNTQVVNDCRARAILVNRADADTEPRGDFITPAKFEVGDVIACVSAGSAALSAGIRDGLRDRFDPKWAAMAGAMRTLRPWLREGANLSSAGRAEVFRRLATDEAFAILQSSGVDGLKAWIESVIAQEPSPKSVPNE